MQQLRENAVNAPSETHVVCSADADLIVMACCVPPAPVFITAGRRGVDDLSLIHI